MKVCSTIPLALVSNLLCKFVSTIDNEMISKEENILFAAEKLFAEKGFDGTSTREVSKTANINISMISYYFGSKEKLYERLVEYRASEGQFYSQNMMDRTDINEWEKVEKIVDQFSKRLEKHRSFYRIIQREQLHEGNPQVMEILKHMRMRFISMYSHILKSGLEKGIFTKSPQPYLLHATISGILLFAYNIKDMDKKFINPTDDKDTFDGKQYTELNQHIKCLLKDLLGYKDNK